MRIKSYQKVDGGTEEKNYTQVDGGVEIRTGSFTGDISDDVIYHISDHLNSAALRLDTAGAIIDREEFYPYGDSSLRTFTKKRYRYTGKEKDAESGLYHYGARYYAAWTCQFLSVDAKANETVTFSPYAYANNNPIMFNDPTGNKAEGGEGGGNGGSENGDNINTQSPAIGELNEEGTMVWGTNATTGKAEWSPVSEEVIVTGSTGYKSELPDQNAEEQILQDRLKDMVVEETVGLTPKAAEKASDLMVVYNKKTGRVIDTQGTERVLTTKYVDHEARAAKGQDIYANKGNKHYTTKWHGKYITKNVKSMRAFAKTADHILGPVGDFMAIADALRGEGTPFAIINPIADIAEMEMENFNLIILDKAIQQGYDPAKSISRSSTYSKMDLMFVYVQESEAQKIYSGEINKLEQLGNFYEAESRFESGEAPWAVLIGDASKSGGFYPIAWYPAKN